MNGGHVGVGVGVSVGVGVGVSVGVGLAPVMVIDPLFRAGVNTMRAPSIKMKLSGAGAQFNGDTSDGLLLTRTMRRLNNVPEPVSGVKSSENADTRRVLIGPGPGKMLADTFQLVAVSPAAWTNGEEKLTTDESKVKSPWNPT